MDFRDILQILCKIQKIPLNPCCSKKIFPFCPLQMPQNRIKLQNVAAPEPLPHKHRGYLNGRRSVKSRVCHFYIPHLKKYPLISQPERDIPTAACRRCPDSIYLEIALRVANIPQGKSCQPRAAGGSCTRRVQAPSTSRQPDTSCLT